MGEVKVKGHNVSLTSYRLTCLWQGWGQIRICICKYKYKYKYGVFVFVFVFDQISNHVFVFVFVFDPPYLVYLTNTFSNTLFPWPFSKHKFMENKLTWIFFINMLKGAILFQNKCIGLILLIVIGGSACALDLACQWVCDKPLALLYWHGPLCNATWARKCIMITYKI